MLGMYYATRAVIERAQAHGFALVGVNNIWMSGRSAYYVEMVARAGLIGIHTVAAPPLVAPLGGAKAALGTNPIAFGFPMDGDPLVIDLGTSAFYTRVTPRCRRRLRIAVSGLPAHGVRGEKGRLVDGGYANNVPLDAAQAVGADEVLIVESSNPLGHETLPWPFSQWLGDLQFRGDLFGNLPQLFTFVWERSQELDRIGRRELLVVSLAPLRKEAEWPNLVEFTSGVIKRMQKVAQSDWTGARRIGMVQSWGRPRFAYTVSAAPPSGEGSKRSR